MPKLKETDFAEELALLLETYRNAGVHESKLRDALEEALEDSLSSVTLGDDGEGNGDENGEADAT